jgi:hypothetical protein
MLMVTFSAIAGNGNVFLVVEQYGLIFVDQTVQGYGPGGNGTTLRRTWR